MIYLKNTDTICAIATPPGRGGVGVIRVSGAETRSIAKKILGGRLPKPRHAHYSAFSDISGDPIDRGIALFFEGPHSFTGEDVLELQGHGGQVVLDMLLQIIINQGARLAHPGEFSARAFLNGKLDLVQAEAVADLIDATSQQAARSAMRSLRGDFSEQIQQLVDELIQLRAYIEAAIDFPEEAIELLKENQLVERLDGLRGRLDKLQQVAHQGSLLRDGLTVAIVGQPNVGKSSLLNALSGQSTAIVTPIAGTTRDVIRESIHVEGIPIRLADTAGLQVTQDCVEQEGIRRAELEMGLADYILYVVDSTVSGDSSFDEGLLDLCGWGMEMDLSSRRVMVIQNKIDLRGELSRIEECEGFTVIYLSAKTGEGVDLLRSHLRVLAGYQEGNESVFLARRRHLEALALARGYVDSARGRRMICWIVFFRCFVWGSDFFSLPIPISNTNTNTSTNTKY
jgi:tRNA modification GTPase